MLDVPGSSPLGFNPAFLVALGGRAYFSGRDSQGKLQLWQSDGTAAGTTVLSVAGVSATSALSPLRLEIIGQRILFYGINAANSQELWQSDGTAAGTTQLSIANAALPGPQPDEIAGFGSKVLFSAKDAGNLRTLAIADPATGQGTVLAVGGAATSGGLDPKFITPFGGLAYFQGKNAAGRLGLWVTDGTAAGTSELGVAGASTSLGLSPSSLAVVGGRLLFAGRDTDGGTWLWSSDGTAAGTVKLAVVKQGASGLAPSGFTLFGGKAYFSGLNATDTRGLWVTDGTAAGTSEIAISGAFAGGAGLTAGVNPSNIVDAGSVLLFEGVNAVGLLTLWRSDGTSAGTVEIPVTGAAAAGLMPTAFAMLALGDVACFAAGTRIRTATGDVAVEALAVGDRVVTRAGRDVAIAWLGHRRLRCAQHARPVDVWPVHLAEDAFGPGQPQRTLRLSPDHAVFVDGVLVPIRYLVNGATIVQQPCETVEYWHVELGAHDVILAEGLPVESHSGHRQPRRLRQCRRLVRMTPDFARGVWARKRLRQAGA